jgi:hypothetical protein
MVGEWCQGDLETGGDTDEPERTVGEPDSTMTDEALDPQE